MKTDENPFYPTRDYNYKGLHVRFVNYEYAEDNDSTCAVVVSLPDGRVWFRETFHRIAPNSLPERINQDIELRISLAESVLKVYYKNLLHLR